MLERSCHLEKTGKKREKNREKSGGNQEKNRGKAGKKCRTNSEEWEERQSEIRQRHYNNTKIIYSIKISYIQQKYKIYFVKVFENDMNRNHN